METMSVYKRLSVRITDKAKKPKANSGSGFLYITGKDAIVFTAAHVVGDPEHEYEIECFCCRDEVEAEETAQYRYYVVGADFKKHRAYLPGADKKQFNPHDVAGVRLEKRPWMDRLPTIRFMRPTAGQVICFSGYPVKKWDESIEFAEKSCHTEVQITSRSEKRLQFLYPEHADWSSLGTVVEGFSGSGVYAHTEDSCVPLLVGILTCGQGANLPHGSINAISFSAIEELCDENSWPSPRYAAEGDNANLPELSHVAASNESILIRQLSEEVRQKIDEMRSLIRSKKLDEALALYDAFAQTAAYHSASENDKCYLLFIKARCHFLMGDAETANALLDEGINYTVPGRYWHLVEKANILMNRMGLPDGAVCLEQAESLLGEAAGLGVKDAKAKIFKRYIEAVKGNQSLDEKLAYVHELTTDTDMDLHGLQNLYNVEGALCAQASRYQKAAECYNTAYSFQGDEIFLLQSAQMYLALAGKSPEQNLLWLAKASDNFVKYLENCGESLTRAFYREMGAALLDCAMALGQYGLILKHADGIIAETENADAVQRMYFMKAFVQIELEEPAFDALRKLNVQDQKALYLHMQFKKTMGEYTRLLEEASVWGVDARAGIRSAQLAMEQYQKKLEETRRLFQPIAEKIQALLSARNGRVDRGIYCTLYIDRINCLLNNRNREEYETAIGQFQELFPELQEDHEINRILLPEVRGEPEKTELLLLKYVSRNRNPQRIRCIMNFYFRNQNFDGLTELYESLAEDSGELGQFGRSQLIWAYLNYLTKPSSMAQKALRQFLKYKEELPDQNLRGILEMRLNHRCCCYHSQWLEDADLWIGKTHHESEYRDAILISVFNLEVEAAEYYYNDYVSNCLPNTSREEQRRQCPGWMWPYFALTTPGEEKGTARLIVNEKLENELRTVRNRKPDSLDGWKLLRSMEEKTVIIDGPSLYYLSKHGLLQNVFRVADRVIVTYSTIGMFLENERFVCDPVIEDIFRWIQSEDRVLLSEASLESQCKFRERFGSDGWYIKGCHCLAKEQNIPVVGAYHNHEGMLEEMKTHILWAGDFVGSIG